ncbi:MAG TPA: hypothetical protein VMF65_24215 [Acidimicrobiales bacterium]|nr:hypothetical protein [Acidimicrobiales bacterium]
MVMDVRLSLVLVLEVLMSHVTVAQRRMIVRMAVQRAQVLKAVVVVIMGHVEMFVGVQQFFVVMLLPPIAFAVSCHRSPFRI